MRCQRIGARAPPRACLRRARSQPLLRRCPAIRPKSVSGVPRCLVAAEYGSSTGRCVRAERRLKPRAPSLEWYIASKDYECDVGLPLEGLALAEGRPVTAELMRDSQRVTRLIPQERVQRRTVERIVHVFVPQVVEDVTEVVQVIPRSVFRSVIDRIVDVPVVKWRQALPILDCKDVGCSGSALLD